MTPAPSQNHGVGQATLLIEPVVRLRGELFNGPTPEEFRRHPTSRRFRRHSLGPVLTKLRAMPFPVWARPRATRTVETILLVYVEVRPEATHDPHLMPSKLHRFKNRRYYRGSMGRCPASGRNSFFRGLCRL